MTITKWALFLVAASLTACGGGSSESVSEDQNNLLSNQKFESGEPPWEVCGSANVATNQTDAAQGENYVRLESSGRCELVRYSERLLLIRRVAARLRQPIQMTEVPSELYLSLLVRVSDQTGISPQFGFRVVANDGVIGEDWRGASFNLSPAQTSSDWSRVNLTFINDGFMPELPPGDIPRWFEVVVWQPDVRDVDATKLFIDVDEIYISSMPRVEASGN